MCVCVYGDEQTKDGREIVPSPAAAGHPLCRDRGTSVTRLVDNGLVDEEDII